MHCLQVPFIYLQLPVAASLKQCNDPTLFFCAVVLVLEKRIERKDSPGTTGEAGHSACRRKLAIMGGTSVEWDGPCSQEQSFISGGYCACC